MRSFAPLVLVVLALTTSGLAQDRPVRKKKPISTSVSSQSPVTQAEAEATFTKVGSVYLSLLHLNPPKFNVKSPAIPVTRSDVILMLSKLYQIAEPKFIVTPTPVKVDMPRVKVDSPAAKSECLKLIQKGCVANYSRLATGPGTTLTVYEFGDAVGIFLARIAEMTHMPSSKWTPYLHG